MYNLFHKLYRRYSKRLVSVIAITLVLFNSVSVSAQEASQAALLDEQTATPSATTTPSITPVPSPTMPLPMVSLPATQSAVLSESTSSAQILPTPSQKKALKLKLKKRIFRSNENVRISVEDGILSHPQIVLKDANNKSVPIQSIEDSQGITLQEPVLFSPGKFELTITNEDGQIFTQNFLWGVLAFNTDKSIYQPHDNGYLQMAVLDEHGNMICNADLSITVTKPDDKTDTLSTKDDSIKINKECEKHQYANKPDYESHYVFTSPGQYSFTIQADTKNGSYTIQDQIEVKESVSFTVVRNTATRIYPPNDYPVSLDIEAHQNFKGIVEEYTPKDFTISANSSAATYTSITEKDTMNVLHWNLELKKGEHKTIGYTFKAPQVSPQFYLLGPLTFKDDTGTIFTETRKWQIAADALDSSQLQYWLTIGPVTGSTSANYVYASFFNPSGSGKTAVISRIVVNNDAVAAATRPNMVVRRITAASSGTQISAANIPKKNTDSSNSIMEARYAGPTVTLVGSSAPSSQMIAQVAAAAAGAAFTTKEFTFDQNEKVILQPGEGLALYQDAAGDADQRNRITFQWSEEGSAPSSQGEYMMSYPRVENAAGIDYVYSTFFNPVGSGVTALVKRIAVDVDADAAAVYTNNIYVRRITAASAGTALTGTQAPKKHTSTANSKMEMRHTGVTATLAGTSDSQLIAVQPPGAANQGQGHTEILFHSTDEYLVLQPGEGIALESSASGDVDELVRLSLVWAEQASTPSSQGEYMLSVGPVAGNTGASYNYATFFNPSGSGKTMIVKRIFLRVNAAAAATYIAFTVRRITAASAGTQISAANIPKKHTSSSNAAMEVRTTGVTATYAGSADSRIISVTSPGAVAQLYGQKEVYFDGSEQLIIKEGEGIGLYHEAAADADEQVRMLVEWKEQASTPSSQGEYITHIGPVTGSTTSGYKYMSFFNPNASGKVAVIKRISIRVDAVAAAKYVPMTLQRITAASAGTQISAANIPKKNTGSSNSVMEIRYANVTATLSGSSDARLMGVTTPGAVGAAAAPQRGGEYEIEFQTDEQIVLQSNEGIVLYQEASGDADFRTRLLVEWAEQASAPTTLPEYQMSIGPASGVTTADNTYTTFFNPTGSATNIVVKHLAFRVDRKGSATAPSYIPFTARRITAASGGTSISTTNIPKINTSTTSSLAEGRYGSLTVTLSGSSDSRILGATIPGAVGQDVALYDAFITTGAELELKPGEGLAFYQEGSAGDANVNFIVLVGWEEKSPVFTQNTYRWYQNADAVQPTTALASENTSTSASAGTNVRLRMNVTVGTNPILSSANKFKLQYSTDTSGPWSDVEIPWWNNNYGYRKQLTVTTTDSIPSGYSVSFTIDHAALVSASKSLSSGNDVRVLYYNGASWTELDRILEEGSSWNNASSQIWFKTQASIEGSGSSTAYYVYYGYASAGSPPTTGTNVFALYDNFNWSDAVTNHGWTDRQGSGNWVGNGSEIVYNTSSTSGVADLSQSLSTTDSVIEAKAFGFTDANNDGHHVRLGLRRDSAGSGYEVSFADNTGGNTSIYNEGGWDGASEGNPAFNQISETTNTNSWYRFKFASIGGTVESKRWLDASAEPGSWSNTWVDNYAASGTDVNIGSGFSTTVHVKFDWVRARKFVANEPSLSAGSEVSTAGWSFKDNATPANGATITSNLLSDSNVAEAYSESNPTSLNPNAVSTTQNMEWDYSLDSTGGVNGTTYYFRMIRANGTALDTYTRYPTFTISSGNSDPDTPSSLAQEKTDDTVIATGDWIDDTSVKFTATATDSDSSDTLYLCVEKQPLGDSFTDTETDCGSGVAYSGSGVTVTVTLSSLTNNTQYHWQARVKDAASAYSSWQAYPDPTPNAESAADFGIDTSDPSTGTVYDGTSAGVDAMFNDGSLSSLSGNWSGFADTSGSGISYYEYSMGTTQGGTDIKTWTNNSTTTSVTASSLTLHSSQSYYVNVRATDAAGNTSTAVYSDGQLILPSLSFSLSANSVAFSNLNAGNSYTNTQDTTLTTSTNAYNGYVIRAYKTDSLRSSIYPSTTIADFSDGSYANPSGWTTGTGFGYTSSDTSIQGSGKFPSSGSCLGTGTAPCYAPFSSSAPGDIVADHTSTVSGSPISNEPFTLTYKVKTPTTQAAGPYTTTIIYTITPQY